MKKIIKYILLVVGGIALVFAAAVAYILVTVNPNDYKPKIIKLVKEKTHRDLRLDGDIKLTVFPSIGLSLSKISLSEFRSDRQFMSVDNARVSLALIPLLSRRVVVNEVALSGAKAELVKRKDGKLNIDDLISAGGAQPEKPAAPEQPAAAEPRALSASWAAVAVPTRRRKNMRRRGRV